MKALKMNKPLRVYFLILALVALALAFSNDVLSNYFKEVYNVTAFQRGLLEFPREAPGVLCLIIISALSFLGDIRISIIAQILSVIGIIILGLVTPSFGVMVLVIFFNSIGMHIFFPLQESIGLSLIDHKNVGRRMGQFKGVYTAFAMIGSLLIFIGFRTGFFSFENNIKLNFLISGILSLTVMFLLIYLNKQVKQTVRKRGKFKITIRKEYKYYYALTILYGVQKQIAMVYGPWIIIDLLGKGTDTLALLRMSGLFIGIFFIPWIGKMLDRFGVKRILYVDALSFVIVYLVFGLMSSGFYKGHIEMVGLPVILMYGIFIIDKMSTQMGMVRVLYLRSIVKSQDDIMPTLSLGISLDHTVSILAAFLGGILWVNFGPQYVFYMAAVVSLFNVYVAKKVERKDGFNEIT